MTANQRRIGRQWRKPAVHIFEKIFLWKAGEILNSSCASRLVEGRFVGYSRSNGHGVGYDLR
eukprot:5406100-Prorocentrum_lima.AAC.1